MKEIFNENTLLFDMIECPICKYRISIPKDSISYRKSHDEVVKKFERLYQEYLMYKVQYENEVRNKINERDIKK